MDFWDHEVREYRSPCNTEFEKLAAKIRDLGKRGFGPFQTNLNIDELKYFRRSIIELASSSTIEGGYRGWMQSVKGADIHRHLHALILNPQIFARPGFGVLYAAAAAAAVEVAELKYRADERDTTPVLLHTLRQEVARIQDVISQHCPHPAGGGARALYLPTTSHEGKLGADFALFTHVTRQDGSEGIRATLVQSKVCGKDPKKGRHIADISSSGAAAQPGRMAATGVPSSYLFYHHDNPPVLGASAIPAKTAVEEAKKHGGALNAIGVGAIDFPVFLMRCFDPMDEISSEFDTAEEAVTALVSLEGFDKKRLRVLGVTGTGGILFDELRQSVAHHLAPNKGADLQITPAVPKFDPTKIVPERPVHREDWRPPSDDPTTSRPPRRPR